jgi:hypothetical protein
MIAATAVLFLTSANFAVCDHDAYQGNPCVVWAESLFYSFWRDHREPTSIYAARITPQGTVIDTASRFIFIGDPTDEINADFDGENLFIVFREHC